MTAIDDGGWDWLSIDGVMVADGRSVGWGGGLLSFPLFLFFPVLVLSGYRLSKVLGIGDEGKMFLTLKGKKIFKSTKRLCDDAW